MNRKCDGGTAAETAERTQRGELASARRPGPPARLRPNPPYKPLAAYLEDRRVSFGSGGNATCVLVGALAWPLALLNTLPYLTFLSKYKALP